MPKEESGGNDKSKGYCGGFDLTFDTEYLTSEKPMNVRKEAMLLRGHILASMMSFLWRRIGFFEYERSKLQNFDKGLNLAVFPAHSSANFL